MAASKQVSSVANNLHRAVDWKLFELTANLISPDVTKEQFDESLLWFQERNAEEVIEERYTAHICGYPLCGNSLEKPKVIRGTRPNKNGERKSTADDHKDTVKYRIDLESHQVFEISRSKYYCCSACLEKCERWMKSLDGTSPYARSITKQLLSTTKTNSSSTSTRNIVQTLKDRQHIDDILAILDHRPPEQQTATSAVTATATVTDQAEQQAEATLPIYQHPQVHAEDGHIEVEVVTEQAMQPFSSSTASSAASDNRIQIKAKDISSSSSVMKQQPSQQHQQQPLQMTNQLATSVSHPQPGAATASTVAATPSSTAGAGGSVEELLATMKALQVKYDLVPKTRQALYYDQPLSSAIAATAQPSQQQQAQQPSPANNKQQSQQQTKKKTVEWDLPENTTRPPNPAIHHTAHTASTIAAPSASSQKTKTATGSSSGSVAVMDSNYKLPLPPSRVIGGSSSQHSHQTTTAGKKSAGVVLGLTIKERSNPMPMSVAAMKQKKEPSMTVGATAAAGDIEGYVPLV